MVIESTDNLSLVLHKQDDLRIEQVPFPGKPGPNGKFFESRAHQFLLNP